MIKHIADYGPIALIGVYFALGCVYLVNKEPWQFVYWLCASGLNLAIWRMR
jgi:hypothetical protein